MMVWIEAVGLSYIFSSQYESDRKGRREMKGTRTALQSLTVEEQYRYTGSDSLKIDGLYDLGLR